MSERPIQTNAYEGVLGTVTHVDRRRQQGMVRAADGRLRIFEREAMVRWLEFLDLVPGDQVRFDLLDRSERVSNVERLARAMSVEQGRFL